MWNYFSDTLNTTTKTFTDNATVFGKVYFPRIILPLSKVLSGLIKFAIQFGLFLIIWLYFIFVKGGLHPNFFALLFPVLLALVSVIALGLGLLITSLTTKYRDLQFLVSFGVTLWMFITPVIYPLNKHEHIKHLLLLNPLTSIFEAFKYGFLGSGYLNFGWLLYSVGFTVVTLLIGVLIFNKVEKRFIDTV